MKRRWPIRVYLFGLILALFVPLLGLFGWLVYRQAENTVRMAYPIRDETGQLTGVLGLCLGLNHYQNLFESHILNSDMVISIINEQGTIITRSLEPEKWIGHNAVGAEIVDMTLAQRQGQTVARDLEGTEQVYSFTTVPGTDWRVYAGIPTTIVYAATRVVVLQGILFGLAVILLVLALVYLLSRHIERPMRRLAQTIQSVTAGSREIQTPLAGPAEVAEVATQFNTMVEAQALTEEALRQSEERLKLALTAGQLGVWEWNLQTNAIFWSAESLEIAGVENFDGRLESLFNLMHPEDIDRIMAAANQAVADRSLLVSEFRFIRPDGEVRWLSTMGQIGYDDAGRPLRLVGIAQDISRRKQIEAALRESEARYHGLFNHVQEAIFIVDNQTNVVDANPAACHLLGYSREELLNLKGYELTPADDLEQVEQLWRGFITGQNQIGGESRIMHKDGVFLEVEYQAVANFSPGLHITILRDITQRKQVEQALRQQAERLKVLNEISRDILAGRSPAKLAETTLTHLRQLLSVERGIVTLFDDEAGEMIILAAQTNPSSIFQAGLRLPYNALAEWLALLRQSQVNVVDDTLALPQPSELTKALVAEGVRSYVSLPLSAQGELIGSLNLSAYTSAAFTGEQVDIVREVADQLAVALGQARLFEQVQVGQKRLEALSRQLLEAQETERRRLAYELHDEIGQTLTAIKLNLQILQRLSQSLQPPVSESIRMVEQAIEQVRDLSLNLRPSLLDDLGLAATLRWFLDRQAQWSGLNIQLRIDPPEMETPPHLNTVCFRVVQEALTNVVRHAQARQVWVELAARESELRLTIQDDGRGFAVEESLKSAIQGVSVGLLGMHERVLLAGGRLEIDSAPDRGTEIRAYFRFDG